LYNISEDELFVLRKFLDKNLAKGFIRTSILPVASLVLFAKKPEGSLRFCIDYCALNTITIKNYYPLPLIQETLARLNKAKIYTKLDVIIVFNHIHITEGQEYLTAFNTRYSLYETLVILFGLSNAPIIFQARINKILHLYLDVFCIAYIDDILVYSDDLTSYKQHVRFVIKALQDAGL
jgi:Reverse transcriptase (RNA-dependent DNA polymerase)